MNFSDLIQQGGAQAWLFIPSAILLGALHGLEPGHSKTMMAAFIIAIRGTVWQAVLLGLTATVSHTLVVWIIALGGMYLWSGAATETIEPYLQFASGIIIGGIALWMLFRTWQEQREANGHQNAPGQRHAHDGGEKRRIDTGHGLITLEVFEDGAPPRWRVRSERGHVWSADADQVETVRLDGARQTFTFVQREGFLESVEEIPEPHAFTARVSLGHAGHSHDYDLAFTESHDHAHFAPDIRDLGTGPNDAHQRAHATDIERRFADRPVTTWQIAIFGLTGGLIPCPAAITVLLLCLQLKEIALGAALVLSFSVGLAITLVAVGAIAAIGARHASNRFPWLNGMARRAPYVSGLLILTVGLYMAVLGYIGLQPDRGL